MKARKMTSYLLLFVLLINLFSSTAVFGAGNTDKPVITVKSVADTAGSTVDVDVIIENNSGILGATLEFAYDNGLTLVDATQGEAFSVLTMTKPGKFTSPCKFVWDGQEISDNDIKNGKIVTLKFNIDENAKSGDEYKIRVSYQNGDIIDKNLNSIDAELVNGSVSVIDFLPGDLDGDKIVNSKDIILLRRHIAGGYDITVNTSAADVNNDGKINTADIILVRRYTAGGYDIELVPSKPKCEHELVEHPYKAPTFTENGNIAYWKCSKCHKLFGDKNGTNEISERDTVISLIEGYSITYYVDSNDEYLKSITIDNPNPTYYEKNKGVELADLIVSGYNFIGWYTAQKGGERVTEITSGESGNKVLYAHWEKVTYTISFASDMVPVEPITYSVGESKPLTKPTLDKYTFVGWSDKNGKIWDEIPAGTTGNITLYANWASNRNKAVAKKSLGEPIIHEDAEKGLILFAYEIGEIQNVPLFTTLNLQCANGIITTVSQTTTNEISETNAKTIAKTVSAATTNSSSWTLSSDWNKNVEISQSYLESTGQTKEEAEKEVKTSSGTYNFTKCESGGKDTVTTDGDTWNVSNNEAHSSTSSEENKKSHELSVSGEVDIKKVVKINGGYKYTNDKTTTDTGTDSHYTTDDNGGYSSTVTTELGTWNANSGYSSSNSVSTDRSISNIISNTISKEYGYGESYAEGGSNSNSQAFATTDSVSDEYSSTITYNTSQISSTTREFSSTGNTNGGYRMVMAGTVHVFAIVGYDVSTKSYFTYTYNVMDDKVEEYLDYSYDGTFNDYETSIIPFELPYFVNEYVSGKVMKSEGLVLDADAGKIANYKSSDSDKLEIVFVPSYISVDKNDNEKESITVRSFSGNAFKGKTNIVGIILSDYITEIPNSAFEGCTSLKYVVAPGVTKIGDNAFKDCISLDTFKVSEGITELGENAFDNVANIKVIAKNKDIAYATTNSGAKNITLDISQIPSDDAVNMAFEAGEIESFELIGKDKEYKGLSVKSDAEKTVINGIAFSENKKVPLEVSSENVTLDRVTIDCSGYAAIFKADNTNLLLNRTVSMLSDTGNAIVSKNISLASLSSNIVGKLNVTGNVLVCDTITDDEDCLTLTDGEIITITSEEFENYINSHKVTFDANGGSVSEENRMVAMNSTIGELPMPSRDYYSFDGWYTDKDGGEKITADSIMTSLTDITLYAHWVKNGVSAWTLASNAPTDAEVVNRKWTYTLTSYTTSNSSSLSGWTNYDTSWIWGSYGDWSGWSTTQYYSSDSRQVEQDTWSDWVDTSYWQHQYHYYHYCCSSGSGYLYTYKKSSSYSPHEIWVNSELPYYKYSGGINWYKGDYCSAGHSPYWFKANGEANSTYVPYERDVYIDQGYRSYYDVWRYRERSKVYTYYYKKSESKESTSMPSGSNISNVQEYVQYRSK